MPPSSRSWWPSSRPYFSSVCFCIGTSRMRKNDTKPAAEKPAIAFHTVAMLAANAARTSPCSVGSSVGMTGMMAYAISAPSGNCCRNAAGRRLLSSFWRMLAEIAMPHVCGGATCQRERALLGRKESERQEMERQRAHLRERPTEVAEAKRCRNALHGEGCKDGKDGAGPDDADPHCGDSLEADPLRCRRVRLEEGHEAEPDYADRPARVIDRLVLSGYLDRDTGCHCSDRDTEGGGQRVHARMNGGRGLTRLKVDGYIVSIAC